MTVTLSVLTNYNTCFQCVNELYRIPIECMRQSEHNKNYYYSLDIHIHENTHTYSTLRTTVLKTCSAGVKCKVG